MAILIATTVFLGLFLILYTIYELFFGGSGPKKKKKKETRGSAGQTAYSNELKNLHLEEEIRNLKDQLEKARLDYANLQKSIEAAKKEEPDVKTELTRHKGWLEASEANLKRSRKVIMNWRQKLKVGRKSWRRSFLKM